MREYQSLLLFLGLCLSSWITPVWAEKLEVKSHKSQVGVQGLHPLSHKSQVTSQNLAQSSQLTRVTGIEVKQTPAGVQVILKTPPGQAKLVPLILPEGNNLLVEILDATLAFSIRNGVTQTNPAPGIKEVRVNKIDATSIRVTIAGEKQAPSAEVVPSRQDLVLSVTPEGATTEQTEAEEEIEIVVTGEREEDNYAVPNSSVGTRTDAEIKDVPQSIKVIPQQVIEDQGETELNSILRNAGVNYGGSGDFSIRGFGTSIVNNGVDVLRNPYTTNLNLSNTQQIEVLKGPASVLYGTGAPGGTVNLTTKQPLTEPRYEISGAIGNFDYYSPSLDFTGPLNENKTILYRLNVNYENTGSFVDFVEGEQFAIFPVLSLELGKNTKLTFEGQYVDQDNRGSVDAPFAFLPLSSPVLSDLVGEIPRNRNLGESGDRNGTLQYNIGYLLEHEFSENWSLSNRFKADFQEVFLFSFVPRGIAEDNRTVSRGFDDYEITNESYTLQTDISGNIETGIIKNELLLGLELNRNINDNVFNTNFEGASPIDLFDPEYGSNRPLDGFELITSITTSDTIGVYAQDLISIGEQVKIIVGGRYDWLFTDTEDRITNTSSNDDNNAFAPRAGIVYQPIEPVSLYGSWSRSFEPQSGTDREGNPYVPITGNQFEVGVKTEFLDGKLAATLAAYQITRQNDLQTDPINPNFSIQIGEQRSRGIELELSGEPLPGWQLIAGYGYVDAKVTEDTTGIEGNRRENQPQHLANLWTVYEIQQGGLEGLGLGAGFFYTGDRFGDAGNTYTLSDYWLANALIYYRRNNWRVQLNAENLFDATYYDGFSYGSPFTIKGQLSAEF
jgi:iron complex outermembrane recepter protein